MREQSQEEGIRSAHLGSGIKSPSFGLGSRYVTGFAHFISPNARSFSSLFLSPSRKCAPKRHAHVLMSARRPGGRSISYFNNVRNTDSSSTPRQDNLPSTSTTDGNGVPTKADGSGLAISGNGTVSSKNVSKPQVEANPARSLPVSLFGLRFNVSGRLILLLVPILWSSYSICLKWLYRFDWAISPALFNAIRLVIAAAAVVPSLFKELRARKKSTTGNGRLAAVVTAGCELGFWTILVNVIQAYGLQFTTASRGAFLGQLSTILVPLGAFLTGMEASIGWNICVASIMAVFGVGLLTLDDVSSSFSWKGDGAMLSTAFVAAAYILRSKVHTKKSKDGPLVALKVISQALFALLYLGVKSGAALKGFGVASLSSMFAGATPLLIAVNIGIILWAGLFISVASTVCQIRGQALVSASEAVVIFTVTPVSASLLAIPLGERFGLQGLIGAALVLMSTILASRDDRRAVKAK